MKLVRVLARSNIKDLQVQARSSEVQNKQVAIRVYLHACWPT